MSYSGGLLHGWFDNERLNHAACRRIAREAGRDMARMTRERTPVHTGHLRESWREKPVVERPGIQGRVFESGVETDVDYAAAQEHGSGLHGMFHRKYPIVPRKPGGYLVFRARDGKLVFTRRVMHPGVRGHHMVAVSAALVEHLLPIIARPALEEWQKLVEESNRERFYFGHAGIL